MPTRAYILSGGKSSRMGQEKGLVQYNGKPMIQWVIDALKPIAQEITIVSNSPDYQNLGFEVIADIQKNKGPLGGIATALNHSNNEVNIILSCDIPEIKTSTLKMILSNANAQVTICRQGNQLHPLIGVYRKSSLKTINKQLETDQLAVMAALDLLDLNIIDLGSEFAEDFKNINRPENLI
ncbi:MAG: molybdenum cofactor guanylyltransferase [Bacteroidia bacterium]